MGKIKDKLLADKPKEYVLSDWEWNYVVSLDVALKTSIYHERLLGGIMAYISDTRLGLKPRDGHYLKFELDINGDDHTLKITEVPQPNP